MTIGIGASGSLGFAFETTWGTYVAPTVFFPIMSESINFTQTNKQRRPIREIADVLGIVSGNSHVEGDVTMEALDDCLPYFLYVSRNSVTKAAGPPVVYTTTPTPHAMGPINGTKVSCSLTVVRNGVPFGYSGCVVTGLEFTIEDQCLMVKINVIGKDEASVAAPTEVWPTQVPYGAGTYTLSVGGSTVTDTDTFTMTVDDSAEVQHRITSVRTPTAIKWGERNLTCKLERDFINRTEYDAWKSYTQNAISLVASQGANNKIELLMPASVKENWTMGLEGQGDLVRSSIDYVPIFNMATSKSYEVKVTTPTVSIT
jgi:hypothetical protein